MKKLIAGMFAAIGLTASAVTVNVYPEGSSTPAPYDSLAAAAATAGPGATVELTGDVELAEKITLNKGTDAKPVIVRSAAGQVYKIRRTTIQGSLDLKNVKFEDVTIDGGADWTHPFAECTTDAEFMACTGIDSTASGNRLADLMIVSGTVTLGAGATLTNAISRQYDNYDHSASGNVINWQGSLVVAAGAKVSDIRGAKLAVAMAHGVAFTLDGGVIEDVYLWTGNGKHVLFQLGSGNYCSLFLKGGTIRGCRSGATGSGPLDFTPNGKSQTSDLQNLVSVGGGALPLVLVGNKNIDSTAYGLRVPAIVPFKVGGALADGSVVPYEYKTVPASLGDESFGSVDVVTLDINVCAISCVNDPRYRARVQGGNLVWQQLEGTPMAMIGDLSARTLTYYGSMADAFATCPNGQTVYLAADAVNTATMLSLRSVGLDLNGFTLSGDPITVGDGASLKVTGSAAPCGFVVNGADAALTLSQGAVGDVTVTRGSFAADYSTGGALAVAAGTKVRLGFGAQFTSRTIDPDADLDDYMDPCDGEGDAARYSLDGGESWEACATLDEAFEKVLSGSDEWYGKDSVPDERFWVIELLRNCTFSKATKSDLTRWKKVDVTIRSDSRRGRRYVMKRTAPTAVINWKCHNTWEMSMRLRLENVIVDGGTVWTNPIDPMADEAANLASTGVDAGTLITVSQSRGVEFGSDCVIRNAKGSSGTPVISLAASPDKQCRFVEGSRVTGIRGAGSCTVVSLSGAGLKVAGTFEDCYAGSGGAVIGLAASSSSEFLGGELRNNVSGGPIVLVTGGAEVGLAGVTIRDNKIAGKSSDSSWNAAYGVVGVGNGAATKFHLSGATVVRNNTRIGDGSRAGIWLGGNKNVFCFDGPIDPCARFEVGGTSTSASEGGSVGNQEVGESASGFERVVAIGNPVGGKYFVGTKNASGTVVFTAAKAYADAGATQALTGDLGKGIYVFNFDEWLNAGQAKVSGTVTWDADTVLSLGVSRAALAKAKGNLTIPLLTATAIDGFDAFLAAKGESLALPKNWELRKVALKTGGEQVQLCRKASGLMLILR